MLVLPADQRVNDYKDVAAVAPLLNRPGCFAKLWPLLALLVIAAIWLYRTPYAASNLETEPDAIEYALAPVQLLETGRYEIILEGRELPSRYPPWFSALVVLPVYVLLGAEPGNAILGVTLLAVTGVAFAWSIGSRISSTAGGMLSALTLAFVPSYRLWAGQVMTDVPCVALMLATCLLFLRLRSEPQARHLLLYFAAGVLVALATLFRPLFAAMLLPFLLASFTPWKAFLHRAAMLLLPMVAAAAATFAYNAATFGTPWRNGYQFWVPVPCDYPALMFSLSNAAMNFPILAYTGFPLLFLASVAGWLLARAWRREVLVPAHRPLRDLVVFLSLTTAPMLFFHLFYFFPGDRFYLPPLAGATVVAGSILGLFIAPQRARLFRMLLPAILLLVVAGRLAAPESMPLRRLAAERIKQWTPSDAIVISSIDPVYLENRAARGSSRRIVPTSRDVEHAGSLLAARRIDHPQPPPVSWLDGRAPGVIRGGADSAVHFVASEQIDVLAAEAQRGRRLFFETTFLSEIDVKVAEKLRKRFELIPLAPFLYELKPF
jgi:4-amino-4-deoxy-L-arabinose transferase-like glycosyltransferase